MMLNLSFSVGNVKKCALLVSNCEQPCFSWSVLKKTAHKNFVKSENTSNASNNLIPSSLPRNKACVKIQY